MRRILVDHARTRTREKRDGEDSDLPLDEALNIGMPEQPGQEMFENLLSAELIRHKEADHIWLEDESQRIGQVNIPGDIWNTMRESPVFFLDIPFEANASMRRQTGERPSCVVAAGL